MKSIKTIYRITKKKLQILLTVSLEQPTTADVVYHTDYRQLSIIIDHAS